MSDEHDHSGIDVDRADRQVIEQAAARLRQGEIKADYAGIPGRHFAFGLALLLDEARSALARPETRGAGTDTVRGARMLIE
jgi:hypothetical protein